jgi:LmbE family N-acetylglucosaminyl deacetylase
MTVLVLAPHADDEVLGMGGTISRLKKSGERVVLAVLTGHGVEPHPIWSRDNWNKIRSECQAAANIMGVNEVIYRELPAACLDAIPAWQVNKVVAEIVAIIQPSEVYIPFHYDLHQDHAAIAYALYVAARPYLATARCIKRVLAYETLSETHLAPPYLMAAFQPNVYVDISDTLETKLNAMRAYSSQIQPDHLPRSIAALKALATLRGTHIGCTAAEGFVLIGEYQR